MKDRETPVARIAPHKRKPDVLVSISPSRSLKDLDKLPVYAPKSLTVEDVDQALREELHERLDDFLSR